ncbi:response regulator receiver domain [Acinetobacter sp. ANC 5033]|uniref:response regulator receiver domain n=1 Tax=Acinetobacter amyesii TaxID=2942470 RepID=UPI00201B89B2|nr:response regulator receiver domain [Acinetobacter amyesii]MCL6238248.1 response regulator receiver domain [Acinetobacter amyesii]
MNSQLQVAPQNFFDESRLIAERFIQTVVAVDDNISFGELSSSVMNSDLQVQLPDEDGGLGASNIIDDELSLDAPDLNSDLNYQELSACFANKSILCSALKVYEGDTGEQQTIDATFNISKKADITILDWQMECDRSNYGNIAKGAIKKLLQYDVDGNGRLRLILIYTSESIPTVLRALKSHLTEFQAKIENGKEIQFACENLSLCKVVVINKQTTIESLVDRSIEEFTHMTCGLLSNATLAAITEIRDKTHHHLYKFNKKLDAAYISHVLGLISSPAMRENAHEVAFDYGIDLLAEEIKSDLQISSQVKKSLSKDVLQKWPDFITEQNPQADFIFKIGNCPEVSVTLDRMKRILSVTETEEFERILEEEPQFPASEPLSISKTFSNKHIQFMFDDNSLNQHLELSAIQCTRRNMRTLGENYKPTLKQGAIIKRQGKNEYYVCIQPLCDSVRLTCSTNFTFLKISKVSNTKPMTHVIHGVEVAYLAFDVDPKSKNIYMAQFLPDPAEKMVKAELCNEKYIFKSGNEVFEWCGEFKQPIFQGIVNDVSASLARVGFDSFEWLRLRKS